MMKREKIRLDLSKVNLFGWEGSKPKLKIESLIKAIKLNDDLPPVRVYKIDEKTYQLTKLSKENGEEYKDGGHSRAVAHYLTNTHLECLIEDVIEEIDLETHGPVNIRDISLLNDKTSREKFHNIMGRDPNYR